MGKISPVSSKYVIHTSIQIDGVVDRPDVIGAIFGQTEGLLGAELELRELQRSGRIGRIEVNVETRGGKTQGEIIIPSSLDKAETSIVGAALEIIQRIGPCNAKLRVTRIEDVRISKRLFVVERAKELLKTMVDDIMPDSQELADEVAYSVRVSEIREYGKDRLAAGPMIDDSDEIIIVEGRADVLNLLKHDFKNAIAINGTSVPQTIVELAKRKTVTVFVDGDRGGDLIIKELMAVTEIDYVAKAPAGKEVEELTKKEIHKAVRARIAVEQLSIDREGAGSNGQRMREQQPAREQIAPRPQFVQQPQMQHPAPVAMNAEEKAKFKDMLGQMVGTRAAFILDGKLEPLGKVPLSEVQSTVKSMEKVYAIVMDGTIDRDLLHIADHANIHYLVGSYSRVRPGQGKVTVLTPTELA